MAKVMYYFFAKYKFRNSFPLTEKPCGKNEDIKKSIIENLKPLFDSIKRF